MPLLSIKDLQVSFAHRGKGIHAVRGITLDLFPGETVGLVGESGCGKSSVAKALLRLLPSSAYIKGQLIYEGKDLMSLPDKQMQKVRGKQIGMIFQDPMSSLNPTLTIGDQIAEGIKRHDPSLTKKALEDEIISLLELVGISEAPTRARHYPHQLSGGMRQRVMIAIALSAKPKILIADEPTTALDVTIQAQIIHLLKDIQAKRATTILLITHDLAVVAEMCSRVLVMYAGKIVESRTTDELFYAPLHPYSKMLLDSLPSLHQDRAYPLKVIEGSAPDLSLPTEGCSFAPRCPKASSLCSQREPEMIHQKVACWMVS